MVAQASKSALVTGGAGFIGSHLVRELLRAGHRVTNLDAMSYAAIPGTLEDVEHLAEYRFVHGDLCDAEQVARVIEEARPDWIFHLAAESHVDRSIDSPLRFVRTNVEGTAVLLHETLRHWRTMGADRARAFRMVHVSTDEVFGALDAGGEAFTVGSRYAPRSPYAATKAASDHLMRAWGHTYGLPVMVTHSTNNYGPFQFPEKLLPLVVLRALAGRDIPIYGHGNQVRDWLHVSDHCRGLVLAAERGNPGADYVFGARNEWRNIDLVQAICMHVDEWKGDAPGTACAHIRHVSDRPGHDFRYAIDPSETEEALRWTAVEDAEIALRATVRWYLDHPEWWRAALDGRYALQRLGLDAM